MGKLIEGRWDCPSCGAKGIKASSKNCPHCGNPQDENTKFYMPDKINYVPDEEAKRISRNPDWECSFCGSLNSDNDVSCRNCGASKDDSKRNYFEMHQQKEKKETKQKKEQKEEVRESSGKTVENSSDLVYEQAAASPPSKRNKNLKSILAWILGLTGVGLILALIISLFVPTVKDVTIEDFSWNRSIEIEELTTFKENDWNLPAKARLLYSRSEIKSYKDVIDHYETVTETKTRQVLDHYENHTTYLDLGNGYFEEHVSKTPVYRTETYDETYQKPVYRQEPVYATKYYYEIDRWVNVDCVKASGKDQNPYWPDVKLKEKQRKGNKSESYVVVVTIKGKDGTKEYSISFDDWRKLEKGSAVKLKVNKLGFAELVTEKEEP